MSKYGLLNFLRIADAHVNADTSTFDGLERQLKAWFAFKYNTTLEDPRLLDMTLEELLVLHQMHRVKDNPEVIEEVFNPEVKSFEEWLKKEMGESYVSDEQMVEQVLEYDKAEAAKREEADAQAKIITEELPDKILTDFSQLRDWEEDK
jgi:hypothetical protein